MAKFLDQEGSILLDAVLTDYGRQLLARGDGSFNVTQFALGDDEVNYELYTSEDLDATIQSMPTLEAITNNIASMNSTLLTLGAQNYLFLPKLKLVSVDKQTAAINGTIKAFLLTGSNVSTLTWDSTNIGAAASLRYIYIDQGIHSPNSDNTKLLGSDLKETQYAIEIDYRFGKIVDNAGSEPSVPTIDDDYMATYVLSAAANGGLVEDLKVTSPGDTTNGPDLNTPDSSIAGQRGTRLKLLFNKNNNLQLSTFSKYGKVETISGANKRVIRSKITIRGLKTGSSISLPIAYAIDN